MTLESGFVFFSRSWAKFLNIIRPLFIVLSDWTCFVVIACGGSGMNDVDEDRTRMSRGNGG